jgi:TnpA family transposase
MDEIRQEYGYKVFASTENQALSKALLSHAMENGNSLYLINTAISELRKSKIILPAMATIEYTVWESRKKAEEMIFSIINGCIADEQKRNLDALLNSKVDKNKTRLTWLREMPTRHSPEAFTGVIEKLEYVRNLNLSVQTSGIHTNRLIQLSRMGARYFHNLKGVLA